MPPPDLARPPGGGVRVVGETVGALFASLARLRRGKPVHPHGAVFEATFTAAPPEDLAGVELFAEPSPRAAVVRFSRSIGLPRPFPDLLGLSLRVLHAYGPDRHQDLLLVTSIDAPILHHLLVPAGDVYQRAYTSLFPYRVNGRSFVIGALPRPITPRPRGETELDRATAAAREGRLSFDLAVAELWGRFRPVGTLAVGGLLPSPADALRFNPWNSGGGLAPAGALNGVRAFVYPRSQRGWAKAGLADAQRLAEGLANERAAVRLPS